MAGRSPWRRSQRWCPRPRRTWRGRAGLCRAGLQRRGRAGRTMPRWLCASQWELTRRRRPSYRAGGGARAAPRRAPLAVRAAAAGSPLAAAQTMGHGRLKEPASAATAVMSSVWSQRGGRRGEQSHAPPRATSAPAASAPPRRRVRRRAGVRGGGEIMRVKNKNNNSNAGEPAVPSPIPLPRGRWWSRGSRIPSVPR